MVDVLLELHKQSIFCSLFWFIYKLGNCQFLNQLQRNSSLLTKPEQKEELSIIALSSNSLHSLLVSVPDKKFDHSGRVNSQGVWDQMHAHSAETGVFLKVPLSGIGSIILTKGLHFLSCHRQCERNAGQLLCYVHLNCKPWSTAFIASTPVLYVYTPRTPTGQGAIQMPLVIVINLSGASSFTEIFISDYVCLIGEEWPGEEAHVQGSSHYQRLLQRILLQMSKFACACRLPCVTDKPSTYNINIIYNPQCCCYSFEVPHQS